MTTTTYTLKSLNGYARMTGAGVATLTGNVIYTQIDADRHTIDDVNCKLSDDEDGNTFWTDPAGKEHTFPGNISFVCSNEFVESGIHGNLGKDSKGYLYGAQQWAATTDTGLDFNFRCVWMPNIDDFKALGSITTSKNKRWRYSK